MMKAVLFDLDGTLVDSAPLWRDALASLIAARHGHPADALFDGLIGMATVDAVATVASRLRWPSCDIESDAHWVEQQVRARYLAGVAWRAGALDLIESLRTAGALTGLVTSSTRTVVDAVLTDRRCPRFDIVVSGDEVAATKPAPDPYLAAVRGLGLKAETCVAVEDSAVGVTSALAAGCAVVAVGPGLSNTDVSNCLHVDSLATLGVADILQLPAGRAGSHVF